MKGRPAAPRLPAISVGAGLPAMFLLAALVLLAACHRDGSGAANAAGAQPASPPPDVDAEHLLAAAPDGWRQVFRSSRGDTRIVEFVSPDSAPGDAWAEKVAFESFGGTPLPDPDVLLTGIAQDQKKTCDRFAQHDTFSGDENGYPTSVKMMICYDNPVTDKGQVTLVKSIRGDDRFYVITRAARTEPIANDKDLPLPAKQMAEWSLYLRAISVCNPQRAEHPCPAAQDAQSAAPDKAP